MYNNKLYIKANQLLSSFGFVAGNVKIKHWLAVKNIEVQPHKRFINFVNKTSLKRKIL